MSKGALMQGVYSSFWTAGLNNVIVALCGYDRNV